MTSLYLCYQSLLEPLTQTQVVAYLEGLALAGYGMVLLTFEPKALSADETEQWQRKLAAKGIRWHWIRYHKRPSVPATAWDIAAGITAGMRLMKRYGVQMLHARAHVPGVMALALKRLTGAKLLFDIRGFLAEEYVDGGVWPANGLLFRATKRMERKLVRAADGIVVLTHKARELLQSWYPREIAGKPVEVIPCCVDMRQFAALTPHPSARDGEGMEVRGPTLVYAGKLGGWYPTEEILSFFAAAKKQLPDLRLKVCSQSDPSHLQAQLLDRRWNGDVSVDRVPPEELPTVLAKARAGLCLYRRNLSKACCSPTKIPEYLAAGLPVVATEQIGDTDEVLLGTKEETSAVGVVVRDGDQSSYQQAITGLRQLLNDANTPARCRAVAQSHFDLCQVGWARYRRIYGKTRDQGSGMRD